MVSHYQRKIIYHSPTSGFSGGNDMLAKGYAHFPDFIIVRNGTYLSLFDHLTTAKTLAALGWALLLGSLIILSALFYLYYSFNKSLRDN